MFVIQLSGRKSQCGNRERSMHEKTMLTPASEGEWGRGRARGKEGLLRESRTNTMGCLLRVGMARADAAH
jgi:hypothetical protein